MRKFVLSLFAILSINCMVFGQGSRISGTVVSEDGSPLAGVSVLVKDTFRGVTTNADGSFTIEVPDGGILQFSFIGMQSIEVAAQPNMRVVMSGTTEIEGVIVTAMGLSRERKTLGYAASVLSGEDIANSNSINPMQALQGKVAGLDVSSSNGVGGTQNVVIRGFSTFGNSQPLYIVDGIPITNEQNATGTSSATDRLNGTVDFGSGINALNPDNIQDMTVLKGAAATALYGSRAANGVILITTKSGSNTDGKVIIDYDGSVTFTHLGYQPQEQKMFGQGWSYREGLDENGSWGPRLDGNLRVWGFIVNSSQQAKPYSYLKNRVKDFYEVGIGYKNNVSFTAGNETTRFFASVSQNHTDGVIPTNADTYDRYTITTNASHRAKNVTVSTALNFSTERNRDVPGGQGNSLYRSVNEVPVDISIVDLKDYKNNVFNQPDNYFTLYGLNPYWVIDNYKMLQNKQKFFGKVELNWDVTDFLNLTYRFGGDYETSTYETKFDQNLYSPDAPNSGNSNENAGSYTQRRYERIQMNHDYFANYMQNFNDFSLNVIAGGNMNERSNSWLQGEIGSLHVPGKFFFSNSTGNAIATSSRDKRRTVAVYGSADLGYRDFIYITGTARNDWSSTLPKKNRSYFYAGGTMSFLVTDLLRQQGINTGKVDFAKFRVAYGKTGNDAEPYYVYPTFAAGSIVNPGYSSTHNFEFPIAGINSYTISNTLGNEELKPELTTEFELGVEMAFFQNRVGFDVSYYNRLTKGLIEAIPRDPSTGYTYQFENLGDVRNKGIELAINFTPVKTRDFRWDMTYNYTRNINKVEKLDVEEVLLGGYSGTAIYAVEGKSMGQFKTYIPATVTDESSEYYGATIVTGEGLVQPSSNMEYTGKSINERFRMGLVNTFTWRNLSLSATLDWRKGGYIYSYTYDYMGWTGNGAQTVFNDRNAFLVPNSVVDNGDGTYSENNKMVDPFNLQNFYTDGGFNLNDEFIISRSFLKLRDLTFTYNLPAKICEKLRMQRLAVHATASNILLWTPVKNAYIDPENTTFGTNVEAKFGEFGANPTNQYYTVGLKLTF